MPPARIIFLPFMLIFELLLLGVTLVVGFFSPDRGLKMVDWAKKHLPDIGYWVKRDKRNKLNNALFQRKDS